MPGTFFALQKDERGRKETFKTVKLISGYVEKTAVNVASASCAAMRELVRLTIAEARRFPVLGSRINQMTRERGVEIVVRLLGEVTESLELGKLPAFGPETIPITAGYFMELIFLPMLMRALSGENLETLRAGIGPHVSQRAAFFLAACRHGGIR